MHIQPSARRAPARRTALGIVARLSIIGSSRLPARADLDRWRRRFLGHEDVLQPAEIAIVEQPTNHALWNLARGFCIEFVAGHEVEPIIEPVNRCRHAGADERRGLNHRGTGKAAFRMTIVQPKERHIPNLAPSISGREGGTLSLCRAVIEQFRQLCEIDRLLPRLAR